MAKECTDSISKGIFLYSIPTWINLVLGFLSVVVLTRVLNPQEYGLVIIFLSSSNVLLYMLTLGLDGAYIRFYNEPPKGNTNTQLLYKILVLSGIVCLASFVIGILLSPFLSNFIFGITTTFVIALLYIFTIAQVALRYLNVHYRMSFNVKMYNIQNVLLNSSTRLFILIGAIICAKFEFVVTVLTIGVVIILLFYLYLQRSDYTPKDSNGYTNYKISLKGFKPFFIFSIFSAPTYIVTYMNTFCGQQIVRSSLDAYALGLFTSTGAFMAILQALKGGFSTYWSAYMYKNYSNDQSRIGKMHDFVVLFSVAITSFLVVFRDVIYLFIGSEFHASKSFFSLLLMLPIFNFIQETTEKGVDIVNKKHLTLISYTIAMVVNICLCYLLIPSLGITGAAYADATSALVLFALCTYWGQKYYKTVFNPIKSFCGLSILVLLMVIPSLVNNIWHILMAVITLDILVMAIYKSECDYVISNIRSGIIHVYNNRLNK